MSQTSLPPDVIQALLAKTNKPKQVWQNVNLKCECGETLDNGYCRNEECEVDAPIPTYECEFCGYCETPGKCVQSITCPKCDSSPSTLCMEGNRYVGFHEERWSALSN